VVPSKTWSLRPLRFAEILSLQSGEKIYQSKRSNTNVIYRFSQTLDHNMLIWLEPAIQSKPSTWSAVSRLTTLFVVGRMLSIHTANHGLYFYACMWFCSYSYGASLLVGKPISIYEPEKKKKIVRLNSDHLQSVMD